MDEITIGGLTAIKSLRYHASMLAPILHEKDKEELRAGGHEPIQAIINGIQCAYEGECYTVFGENDEPLFIAGICDIGNAPEMCTVWLLSTFHVNRYARQLIKASPLFLDRWQRMCPRLVNCIWEGNGPHLRWVKLMNFNIGERVEFNGAGFIPVERTLARCANP